jgi:hypothetical protein
MVTAFYRRRSVAEGSESLEGVQLSVRPTMSWNKDKVRQVQEVILSGHLSEQTHNWKESRKFN